MPSIDINMAPAGGDHHHLRDTRAQVSDLYDTWAPFTDRDHL